MKDQSYPPIYVINLKRTPERKLNIKRQLDALNLKYRFIEAVDKYQLDSKIERTVIARQLGISEFNMESLYKACIAATEVGTGALACALSHTKIYNLMIENNTSKACVLEDDAYILPVFPEILVHAQKVPWDILMLFHYSTFTVDIISRLFIGRKFNTKLNLSLFNLCRYFYRLVCYKRYYPHLNPHTVRWIISTTVKYLLLRVPAKLFNIKITKYATRLWWHIGALPVSDRSTWYRTIPDYYIARAYRDSNEKCHIKSAVAYMLTKSAATKLKNEVIIPRKPLAIDSIINNLSPTSSALYLSIPPCVKMANIGNLSTREH